MIGSAWMETFARIAIILPAFLVAVSFHEFCHAFVAYLLGDDTAKRHGRLTINPLAHIDPLGLLFLLIFRIGWANPVPIDQRNFSYPRLFAIVTALAGPLSNFLIALLSFICIKYLPATLLSTGITITIVQVCTAMASINIMLGVFNLLPIPPLDGSHIMTALLIKPFPKLVSWIYRYSLFILLALFMIPQMWQALSFLIIQTEHFIRNLVF